MIVFWFPSNSVLLLSLRYFVPCKMKARISLLLLQVHLAKLEAADLYLSGERQEDRLPHVCC